MKTVIALTSALFVLAGLTAAVTHAGPADLVGPLGPGGEELGVGGDDDQPSHSVEIPPSSEQRLSSNMRRTTMCLNHSLADRVAQLWAAVIARVQTRDLPYLGTGAND